MKFEEEIAEFDRLVPKAVRLHTFTWCVKRKLMVYTAQLKGEECVPCSEFVLRGGVCDPL